MCKHQKLLLWDVAMRDASHLLYQLRVYNGTIEVSLAECRRVLTGLKKAARLRFGADSSEYRTVLEVCERITVIHLTRGRTGSAKEVTL